MIDRSQRSLLIGMALVTLVALLTGRLAPQLVPDSADYLRPLLWPDCLTGNRTPFFGLFASLLGGATSGYVLVPIANATALFVAILLLFNAVRQFGLSDTAALALTLPILISNPVLLFLGYVHPEITAIACVLAAMAAVIRLSGDAPPHWRHHALLALGAGTGYLLKPAFLFFVPMLPVLSLLLSRLHGTRSIAHSLRQAALVFVLSALAFVGYAGVRASFVGEFNIVSFGGYASSGLSGLMLNPKTIDALPERHRPLARAILVQRDVLAARGDMLPIPYNSDKQRSFTSAALGYFDVLARSYDIVVSEIVVRQMQPGESWMAFNARLQDFLVAVIRANPEAYMAWIVGACTRVAGLITITNAAFMLTSFALGALFIFSIIRSRSVTVRVGQDELPPGRDVAAIILIAGLYTLANWLPMVLVSFPARRYVDTAGLLFAALPFYALLRLWPVVFVRSRDQLGKNNG